MATSAKLEFNKFARMRKTILHGALEGEATMIDRQLILYGALVCLIIAAVMVPLGLAAAILSSETLLCLIIAAVVLPSVLLVLLLVSLRLGHDAVHVNLHESIRISKAHNVLLGLEESAWTSYPKKTWIESRSAAESLPRGLARYSKGGKELADSPLVMVG